MFRALFNVLFSILPWLHSVAMSLWEHFPKGSTDMGVLMGVPIGWLKAAWRVLRHQLRMFFRDEPPEPPSVPPTSEGTGP